MEKNNTTRKMSRYIKSDRAKSLLSAGFSVIVVDEKKMPVHKWKEFQQRQPTAQEMEHFMSQPTAWRFGYPCGFGDLFCVDIDLKVLPYIHLVLPTIYSM